ncbi:MAG: thioredoxin domain-containing protein [Alphaproteobacteria bacterium]|nr:thioredoxin domain-containing protein [Alphaproteobacteria bacterium]
MTSHLFKRKIFPALLAVVICFGGFSLTKSADAADKQFSKSDVEQIIHDYILNNPQIILNSVDDHQKKTLQAHQGDALEKNKEFLFNDSSSPSAGNPDGDVTIVEFFDYNCYYCKNVFPDVMKLLEKDKKVRFVFRESPVLGPTSEIASRWALAAQEQKKYFEYHKALMFSKEPITDELLEKIAVDIGLDISKAKKDINGADVNLQLEKNRALVASLGINGVPVFTVDGEIKQGAVSLEQMEKMVSDLRKRKEVK